MRTSVKMQHEQLVEDEKAAWKGRHREGNDAGAQKEKFSIPRMEEICAWLYLLREGDRMGATRERHIDVSSTGPVLAARCPFGSEHGWKPQSVDGANEPSFFLPQCIHPHLSFPPNRCRHFLPRRTSKQQAITLTCARVPQWAERTRERLLDSGHQLKTQEKREEKGNPDILSRSRTEPNERPGRAGVQRQREPGRETMERAGLELR